MRTSLIDELVCPYCGHGFHLSRTVDADGDRIAYGLLRCACFEFPIVEGVLLLSLAKDDGGPETELLPYAALLVASIHYLERDDVAGLKDWMRRHVPLAAALFDGRFESYLEFTAAYELAAQKPTELFLARSADLEVLGDVGRRSRLARRVRLLPGTSSALGWIHELVVRLRAARREARSSTDRRSLELEQLWKYFPQRFFCPRAIATSLALRHLPLSGRILSVCCGHGVFENLVSVSRREPTRLVSIDSHFLSLLAVRHLIRADADLVCHELEFTWPFRAGAFDGVFSSTCLPEIPSQRHFVREAVRVTAPHGWTAFDSIWACDSGAPRVDPMRHYRFCQNFLDSVGAYVGLFQRSLPPGRRAIFDVSGSPADYLGGPRWLFDEGEAHQALAAPLDSEISALVISESDFSGFESQPSLGWIDGALSLSPAFEVTDDGPRLRLRRRPSFAKPSFYFASRSFGTLPETVELTKADLGEPARVLDLYSRAIAAPLPRKFMRGQRPLSSYEE